MQRRRLACLVLLGLVIMLSPGCDAGGDQDRPGDFDYYVLVLGWSPSYCTAEGRERRDRQCDTEKRRAFVLHGLWPQHVKGWPQDCRTGKHTWVPQSVIDEMLDIMPSKGLIIHEYRTHGTCAGLEPRQYFELARDFYERISIPTRFAATESQSDLSPEKIEEEFLQANAWLEPSMISVSCRRRQLLDVRICFGRDLLPTSCGTNEARRQCRADKVIVSPPKGESIAPRD